MGASLRMRHSRRAINTCRTDDDGEANSGACGGVYEKMKNFAINALFHSARRHRRGASVGRAPFFRHVQRVLGAHAPLTCTRKLASNRLVVCGTGGHVGLNRGANVRTAQFGCLWCRRLRTCGVQNESRPGACAGTRLIRVPHVWGTCNLRGMNSTNSGGVGGTYVS